MQRKQGAEQLRTVSSDSTMPAIVGLVYYKWEGLLRIIWGVATPSEPPSRSAPDTATIKWESAIYTVYT